MNFTHTNIPIYKPRLSANAREYVADAVSSTWVSGYGAYVDKLELGLINTFGGKKSVSCNTGTAAVHLALIASGVKAGDEVILPNLTFVASANAIKYCGATPVFVDVDPETWNIDPSLVKEKITPKTKAIMPCHLYGSPSDIEALSDFNVPLVHDACEAIGALYKNRHISSYGIAAYSLFGNKTITCGEGGFVITNSSGEYETMRTYRGHCQTTQYDHFDVGYNYRLSNVLAALACSQLEDYVEIQYKKYNLHFQYSLALSDLKDIKIQRTHPKAKHGCWMFGFTTPYATDLRFYLQGFGIETRRGFRPMSSLLPYRTYEEFPVSSSLSNQIVLLPSYPDLTDKEQDFIVTKIRDFFHA